MAWLSQLRFAFRSLARAPLSTLLGALSLSIGLAAAITAASLAETLLFAPLPGVEAGEELVKIEATDATGEAAAGLSHPAYRALAGAVESLGGIAALSDHVLAFRAEGEAEAVLGQTVTASYFTVLGARPAAGRFFLPQEDATLGAHPVVVLSHAFWQRRFGGDPAVVGRRVSINGSPFTVVGIAGPGFRGAFRGFRFDVWTPLAMAEVVEPRQRLDDWKLALARGDRPARAGVHPRGGGGRALHAGDAARRSHGGRAPRAGLRRAAPHRARRRAARRRHRPGGGADECRAAGARRGVGQPCQPAARARPRARSRARGAAGGGSEPAPAPRSAPCRERRVGAARRRRRPAARGLGFRGARPLPTTAAFRC